jgi:hypothetical protein
MKNKPVFAFGFLLVIGYWLLVIGLVFMACENGNDTGGGFVPQTVSVSNDKTTLGLVGTTVASNKTNIVNGIIESGEIKITSAAEGYATITVSDGSVNAAGISVNVSKTGAINIAYISKYNGTGSGTETATGQDYNVIFGNFGYASDADIQSAISANGWTDSVITTTDGKYLKGSDANKARTFFLNHPDFELQGGADGTWDYLTNTFKYQGVGLPDGDLKTKMTSDVANCPLAGMFRSTGTLVVFYVSKNND